MEQKEQIKMLEIGEWFLFCFASNDTFIQFKMQLSMENGIVMLDWFSF